MVLANEPKFTEGVRLMFPRYMSAYNALGKAKSNRKARVICFESASLWFPHDLVHDRGGTWLAPVRAVQSFQSLGSD